MVTRGQVSYKVWAAPRISFHSVVRFVSPGKHGGGTLELAPPKQSDLVVKQKQNNFMEFQMSDYRSGVI